MGSSPNPPVSLLQVSLMKLCSQVCPQQMFQDQRSVLAGRPKRDSLWGRGGLA